MRPTVQPARTTTSGGTVAQARAALARQRRQAREVEVTLVDLHPGLDVVGLSPDCCGYEGTRPPRLLISTNLRTWRDITPPTARRPARRHEGFGFFESASFVNADVGWVESWNPADVRVTIYRTIDGGRTWSTFAGGYHTASAGGITLLDALSGTMAYRDTQQPTGPGEDLAVTTDGGEHWDTVWTGPLPRHPGQRVTGPFDVPLDFTTPTTGFAADGVGPPSSISVPTPGLLFMTLDGGRRWTRLHPPRAGHCHTSLASVSTCPFATPTFSDAEHGVLPYVSQTRRSTTVGFDTTTDGGFAWQSASRLHLPSSGGPARVPSENARHPSLPLVSVASSDVWWVGIPHPSALTLWRTTNAGRSWSRQGFIRLDGTPQALHAVSADDAALTELVPLPHHNLHDLLFRTTDGGHSWLRVHAIDREPAASKGAPAHRCTAHDVSVTTGPFDAAAGAGGTPVRLINTSAHACTLKGYVGITFLSRHRQPRPTTTDHGGVFSAFIDPGPRVVRLEPGRIASTEIGWDDNAVTKDGRTQRCRAVGYLRIALPDGAGLITVRLGHGNHYGPYVIGPCGGALWTSALQPGPDPRKT